MKTMPLRRLFVLFVSLLLAGCAATQTGSLQKIEHVVVIYAENHSFDNMYGMFPGANGVANATAIQMTQVDHDGKPLAHLPPVYTPQGKPDPKYPQALPNGPFRIDAPPVGAKFDEIVPSPIHNYYQNIEQINGGSNNRFVAMTTVGAWAMGYYDGSSQKMWQWARDYTLADNFFMGAFGGSFLNHQWLVCACTPVHADAPAAIRAQLDANGLLKRRPGSPPSVMQGPVQVFDGRVTPDGYAVNTSQPPYQPSGIAPAPGGNPDLADPSHIPVPPQSAKTIGDTLSAKSITWAWYAGGWDQALADGRRDPREKRAIIYNRTGGSPNFQPHHQPFNYFARFAPGMPDRAQHLKDGEEFLQAIDKGTLPQVTFYKPAGRLTQHPSYTDLHSGDEHIAGLLERLRKSPQ
jgi:acid phosphatase